jgi:transposase
MGKVYDQAYKKEICKRAVEGGEAVSAISREVGISENTLYGWVARYRENKEKPFVGSGHVKPEDEAIKKLQRENKELREENEILKKAAAYFAKNQK